MYKILFSLIFILQFFGCSTANNNLYIVDKKENIVISQKPMLTNDFCTEFSYISNENDKKYGKIFIEYIDLAINCSWSAYARGYFLTLFKDTLKIKSLKTLEILDYGNYEFSAYLVDDKYYVNLIYKFSATESVFILDYSGKLYEELVKGFDKSYKNRYINKLRFDKDYSQSLADKNMLFGYFRTESEEVFDKK